MKNSFILFFVFFLINVSFIESQTQQALLNRTKHWRFGHKAGMDFNMATGVPTVFNGSNGVVYEGNSCISDTSGNLLFYCTGDTIWNRNHQMMLNGDGMPSDKITILNSVIIPRPGNPDHYYIFINECVNNSSAPGGMLKYSLIDMTLDGGNGAVVSGQKNIPVFHHTINNLAFSKHANNINYWLAYSEKNPPYNLCMVPVTASGPDTTNRVVSSYNGPMGFSRFSPDNTLLASTGYEIFQFNSTTGVLSSPIILPTDSLVNYSPVSTEFSSNSKVLYFSLYQGGGNHNLIQQFDLSVYTSTAIASSQYSFFDVPPLYCSCSLGHMQLAPNGKIYIAKPGGTYPGDSLHIIHNPNGIGASCNYQYNALGLNGKACDYSLPIYPDYYLNNIPILTSIIEKEKFNSSQIAIYPNPCSEILMVNFCITNNYLTSLYNQLGQQVFSQKSNQSRAIFNTSQLPSGLYYISIQSSFGSQTKKIIINH